MSGFGSIDRVCDAFESVGRPEQGRCGFPVGETLSRVRIDLESDASPTTFRGVADGPALAESVLVDERRLALLRLDLDTLRNVLTLLGEAVESRAMGEDLEGLVQLVSRHVHGMQELLEQPLG